MCGRVLQLPEDCSGLYYALLKVLVAMAFNNCSSKIYFLKKFLFVVTFEPDWRKPRGGVDRAPLEPSRRPGRGEPQRSSARARGRWPRSDESSLSRPVSSLRFQLLPPCVNPPQTRCTNTPDPCSFAGVGGGLARRSPQSHVGTRISGPSDGQLRRRGDCNTPDRSHPEVPAPWVCSWEPAADQAMGQSTCMWPLVPAGPWVG